jgi:hypothetical protein
MKHKIYGFVSIIAGYLFSLTCLCAIFFRGGLYSEPAQYAAYGLTVVYCFGLWLVFGQTDRRLKNEQEGQREIDNGATQEQMHGSKSQPVEANQVKIHIADF